MPLTARASLKQWSRTPTPSQTGLPTIGELGPGILQTAIAAITGGVYFGVGTAQVLKKGLKGELLKQAAKKQRQGIPLNDAERKAFGSAKRILAAAKANYARRGAVAAAGAESLGMGIGEVGAEIMGPWRPGAHDRRGISFEPYSVAYP